MFSFIAKDKKWISEVPQELKSFSTKPKAVSRTQTNIKMAHKTASFNVNCTRTDALLLPRDVFLFEVTRSGQFRRVYKHSSPTPRV